VQVGEHLLCPRRVIGIVFVYERNRYLYYYSSYDLNLHISKILNNKKVCERLFDYYNRIDLEFYSSLVHRVS